MAKSLTVRAGSTVGTVHVWTFEFRGGPVFSLRLHERLNPSHEHNGRMSIWKFVGTEEESADAEKVLSETFEGLRVKRWTEVDDPAADRERQRRLGRDPEAGA